MTYFPLTKTQREWQERVADLAQRELAPRAEETDRTGQYPQESLEALQRAGLWGLRVSQEHGGLGADLLTTCLIVEETLKTLPVYRHVLQDAPGSCRDYLSYPDALSGRTLCQTHGPGAGVYHHRRQRVVGGGG